MITQQKNISNKAECMWKPVDNAVVIVINYIALKDSHIADGNKVIYHLGLTGSDGDAKNSHLLSVNMF